MGSLDNIAKGALLVLGVGILSDKLGGGAGLGSLGTGISSIVSSPGVGIGTGLSATAGGLNDIFSIFTGFMDYWENFLKDIPGGGLTVIPPWLTIADQEGPAGDGSGSDALNPLVPPLINVSGGGSSDNLAGGGGNTLVTPYGTFIGTLRR